MSTDQSPAPNAESIEADDIGEKPDLGRTPDALKDQLQEALQGTDSGSDTRAGSLRGGSASGSDDDPDSAVINQALAEQGRRTRSHQPPADPEPVKNTGEDATNDKGKPAKGQGDDVDAATG